MFNVRVNVSFLATVDWLVMLYWFPSQFIGFSYASPVAVTLPWFQSHFICFNHNSLVSVRLHWMPSHFVGFS